MSRKESESSGHTGEKVREESKCRRAGTHIRGLVQAQRFQMWNRKK